MEDMMITAATRHDDDIAVWADGAWATLEDVRAGEFDWISDDYEIISHLDTDRLIALGVYDAEPD